MHFQNIDFGIDIEIVGLWHQIVLTYLELVFHEGPKEPFRCCLKEGMYALTEL